MDFKDPLIPPLYNEIFKEATYNIHALPILDMKNTTVSEHTYINPNKLFSPVMKFIDSTGRFGIAIKLTNIMPLIINGTKIKPYEKQFVLTLLENKPKWTFSCPFKHPSKQFNHQLIKSVLSHRDEFWGIIVLVNFDNYDDD
jgi:hypothetical protein